MDEGHWQDDPDAPWAGLRANWDVGAAVADLTRVANRLGEVDTERSDPRATRHLRQAVGGLALSINALFASADVQCDIDQPPEDVTTRPWGPGGDMITTCFHDPAHCWDGTGHRMPSCP